MSWSWSHTVEAQENVRQNIALLPLTELREIWLEIETFTMKRLDLPLTREDILNSNGYWSMMFDWLDCQDKQDSQIVQEIWEFTERLSECTNGGHRAFICPYQCHSVSFSAMELTGKQLDV